MSPQMAPIIAHPARATAEDSGSGYFESKFCHVFSGDYMIAGIAAAANGALPQSGDKVAASGSLMKLGVRVIDALGREAHVDRRGAGTSRLPGDRR